MTPHNPRPRIREALGRNLIAVGGPLVRRIHVFRSRRGVRTLVPLIAKDREVLREFDDCTSHEFSLLATKLSVVDTQLSAVGKQAEELDRVLQDKDDDRALSSAFELYKRSVDLAHATLGISISQEEQMSHIEVALLKNQQQFTDNSLLFRLLIMNIRAEAAHVDPENRAIFNAVSDEIGAMEKQMHSSVETAFSELAAIVAESAAGRAELNDLQAGLHTRARTSIELLRDALGKIKASLVPCADANRKIGELMTQTRSLTADLIVALQYQDIVRQKLEHVSLGFQDIARVVGGQSKLTASDLGYLNQAGQLQRAHLDSSRRSIVKAGEQITAGSASFLEAGAALVALFATMKKSSNAVFKNAHISEIFAAETASLVAVTNQSDATHGRISRLLNRIEKTLRLFSTEIGRCETEVLIVSLNCQIAAAHVPSAGALNKLAEQTAELSARTTELTREMGAALQKTLQQLQSIRTEADEAAHTLSKERADLALGTSLLGEKMTRFYQRIQGGSELPAEEFKTAYEEVHTLLANLQFPAQISASYAPATQLCDSLTAATAAFGHGDLDAQATERLAAHRARYTMRDERDTDAALNESAHSHTPAPTRDAQDANTPALDPAPESETSAPPSATREIIAEGVELF